MVRIRLFGGVSAVTGDDEPVDVGPAKCQAVLAALALSPGSAVPVSRLVEMVWGEDPPRTAEKTLQSYVTRLRKGLGPDAITRTGAAYRLEIDADAVDVGRFQRRLDSGDLKAALAEWAGTPLAGLDAEGLGGSVDRLVEQWLGAVEADLERHIETDPSATIGTLTELTAEYPFREGLWALLMTALYGAGRQADALAAYRRAREHLIDQLGVEPGLRLRELETLILGQDEQLRTARSSRGPASGRASGTVTFGFSEVEGATRLWAGHQHEMAVAMARHDELVRAVAAEHGGYVFAAGSDAFGVAFGRPRDAAAWAEALQEATSSERWPGGMDVRVRVGLHTGEAEERGEGYFGPAVNVAARLAVAGHGGQTLVSDATAVLLERSDLAELGTHRLDGVVADQRILQLGGGEYPPLRTAGTREGNLPRRLGRLIGRHDELELITETLGGAPIVTLVGPGGIGKTRLALAAGRRLEADLVGGAWLIELAGIASSSDVPRAAARTLDIRESSARTLTDSIVRVMESRHALLVLDNCEHVVEGAAELAQAIVDGCPNVRLLATSREGLGLGDERLIAVAPLEPSGAGVELFNERAAAADQTFDATASRSSVEEICRRLDGVPLAIELAAARTRSLSPEDLVARLDDRFRLLTGGRRSSVERHRTLRATIQWSYDLLAPPKRLLFQRLSIFAGPFDLAAAEAVAADAELDAFDVDDLLGGLVERSMLIVESGPFGRRFRLLETMRQFGAEHLSETGQSDLIAERHAEWCLSEVRTIHELLAGPEELEGVARLGELWPNVRAAFEWADATDNRALADALVRPLVGEINTRIQSEIGDWAERILAMTPPENEDAIAYWLTWGAIRYTFSQDHQAYERLAERYGASGSPLTRYGRAFLYEDNAQLVEWGPKAEAELRRLGEDLLADLTRMGGKGQGLMGLGRFEECDALMASLVDHHAEHGPPTLVHWAHTCAGFSTTIQGDLEAAERFFEQAAAVDVPDGTLGMSKLIEARVALRRGNRARAFQILKLHIDELLEADMLFMSRMVAIDFANMMVEVDRLVEAACALAYLETTNMLHEAEGGFRSLVAQAAEKVAASVHEGPAGGLDDRQALAYMSEVLAQLVEEPQKVN